MMFVTGFLVLQCLLGLSRAQQPYFPPAFPPTPILPSSINYAPSVTPTIQDPTAPDPQQLCPGYTASNLQQAGSRVTADLVLAGQPCNVFGNDIQDLTLLVEYQTQQRLNVRIQPKYLAANNESQYVLSAQLTPLPAASGNYSSSTSDLSFTWSNTPSFQFQVTRRTSGEVLFSTYGTKLIFSDQFLELTTSMVPNYNIYGLASSLRGFRFPTTGNYTQTFWNTYNLMNDQVLDVNGHDTHPMYLETRYGANGASSTSHAVYARNAHGQEWLLKTNAVTYRTLGGSFDFYFLSGPTAKSVIAQYQTGIAGTPFVPAYWQLGFFQCRWGYESWDALQAVVDGYANAGIQLEAIMSDLDYLLMNRIFTLNPGLYDQAAGQVFLDRLHANGQYWLPILDPNVYVPNPANASDAYSVYDSGESVGAYIQASGGGDYIGVEWPGFSVWPDFLTSQAQDFWTQQVQQYHSQISFDGFWLDVSDASVFCTGSCGTGMISMNPIHVPFALPGDPDTMMAVDYRYPEGFEVTNATEAASATSAMMSQSSMYPTPAVTPTPVLARTLPTPGVRNLTFPPYAINNFLEGHSLVKEAISPDAVHRDGTTEYELHNLYGHLSANATYNALVATYGGNTRPFFMARSTFVGSGQFAGHWGGDTNAKWGNMYFGISQALTYSIVGIPYFGVETCGFNGNTDLELCTRWMQLSAWFPMYRNHNNRNTIAQEAYRWATVAESTRRIMNIRYSLLPYTYTLFHLAHTAGETVLRSLAWEFPDDPSLAAVETQFMSGPAILVTPVLAPLATTVQGVFPGVAAGTVWYDWYTLSQVYAAPGENKTLSAPLVQQPIHIRGGYVVPLQQAGNTTKTSRQNPWSLIVALDKNGAAQGQLYLDDGISIVPQATKNVQLQYNNSTLSTIVTGTYVDGLALSNVTIAGIQSPPSGLSLVLGGQQQDTSAVQLAYANGTLYISGLNGATSSGVWSSNLVLSLQYGAGNGGGGWRQWTTLRV